MKQCLVQQVWFQNQRAKMKKIQKKARQDNKNGKEIGTEEEKEQKMKVKEEEHSKLIHFLTIMYNKASSVSFYQKMILFDVIDDFFSTALPLTYMCT